MSSYFDLRRSSSNCVLFILDDQHDVLDQQLVDHLGGAGIRVAYFDCHTDNVSAQKIAGVVGERLGLEHAPYESWAPPTNNKISVWVPFFDDMISLEYHRAGAAIVIDNAFQLLADDRVAFFGLIEAFLIQFNHWFEKGKPCHLCLQMVPDPLVKQFFGQGF